MSRGRGKDKTRRRRRRFVTNAVEVSEPDAKGNRTMGFFVEDKVTKNRTHWKCRFDGKGNLIGRVQVPDEEVRRKHREAAREGAKYVAAELTRQLGLFEKDDGEKPPATPTAERKTGT